MEAGVVSNILAVLLGGLCVGIAVNGVVAARVLHLHPFVAVWPALLAFGAIPFTMDALYKYASTSLTLQQALALFFTLQVLFLFLALPSLKPTAHRLEASVGLAVIPWTAVVASPFVFNVVRSYAAP